jgi:hypothetical protein
MLHVFHSEIVFCYPRITRISSSLVFLWIIPSIIWQYMMLHVVENVFKLRMGECSRTFPEPHSLSYATEGNVLAVPSPLLAFSLQNYHGQMYFLRLCLLVNQTQCGVPWSLKDHVKLGGWWELHRKSCSMKRKGEPRYILFTAISSTNLIFTMSMSDLCHIGHFSLLMPQWTWLTTVISLITATHELTNAP